MPSKRYTVAVDFDGVLHSYTSPWFAADVIPDPPVPGAIEWLRQISERFEVVIHTTRGDTSDSRAAIRKWLSHYGWEGAASVRITNEKVPALVYLDDRAIRFTGTFPTADEVYKAKPWNKQNPNKGGTA